MRQQIIDGIKGIALLIALAAIVVAGVRMGYWGNPPSVQATEQKQPEAPKEQLRLYVPGASFVCIAFHADGRPVWKTDTFDRKEKLTITCESGL